MQDRVRRIVFESNAEANSAAIDHNHDLQEQLVGFLTEEAGQVFIGAIGLERTRMVVQFEVLGDDDPDALVACHTPAHGAGGSGGGVGTGDALSATTREPDAAGDPGDPGDPGAGDPGDDDPGTEPNDDGQSGTPRPYALVRQDGSVIATYASDESAWAAFEEHNDAFDVVDRTAEAED